MYRFEHKISTTDGGQPGGRLAYAGLTGGFGSITLGQIWSAAYNHAGAITDKSYYFGDSAGTYRHGNALSYAFSSGALGFQLDLISDGGTDTDKAIDKTEFGVTLGLGEVGRVAIAHTNMRDAMDGTYWVDHDSNDDTAMVQAQKVMVHYSDISNANDANVDEDGMLTTAGLGLIQGAADGKFYFGADAATCDDSGTSDVVEKCDKTAEFYVRTVTTIAADGTVAVAATEHPTATMGTKRGHKTTHMAVEFSVGGFTPYLGYSKSKKNGATKETKTTHYGVSGGLGDSGINYLVAARSVKDVNGKKTSPWLVNVSKSLGGGATVIFEHGNDDNNKSGKSRVGLHVTF